MLSDCCPVLYVRLSVTLMYCGQTVRWINMNLAWRIDLGPGHTVLDGDPAPRKMDTAPQCSAHVRCGQTTGWIKMPLGTEVRLGPGDIVLDGDPSSSPAKK